MANPPPPAVQNSNGNNGTFNNNTGNGIQLNLSNYFNGNIYRNTQNIGTQINYPQYAPSPDSSTDKRDRLAIFQERYLVATNPTELIVKSVDVESWLGDTEQFVTVEVENPSNIPANKLKISIIKPDTDDHKSRSIAFKPSKALTAGHADRIIKNGLFLPQKASIKLPIGSISQLIQSIEVSPPGGYTFLGVGQTNVMPPELCDGSSRQPHQAGINGSNSSTRAVEYASTPLAVALKYETIFDQHLVRLFPLYVYFGKCEIDQSPEDLPVRQ